MTFKTIKTGDPFISLEEFLQLPESTASHFAWGASFCGAEWMFRYQLAKESWEKYGNNPPDGATVGVLVNGHGTYMPSLITAKDVNLLPTRTLVSKEDKDYFYLLRNVRETSLVDKSLWWRSVLIKSEKWHAHFNEENSCLFLHILI